MASGTISPITKRYYPKARVFSWLAAIGLLAAAVLEGSAAGQTAKSFSIVGLSLTQLLFIFSGVVFIAQAQFTYITTSAVGIIYRETGLHTSQTNWANIERVYQVGNAEYLVLHEPANTRFAVAGTSRPRGLTIPLSKWDKYDELMDELREHIPHIIPAREKFPRLF